MKRGSRSEASSKDVKIRRSEVECVVRLEAERAARQSEKQLDGLIERLQQDLSCEKTIVMLQNRISTLQRRGDAALAHIAMLSAQSPTLPTSDFKPHSSSRSDVQGDQTQALSKETTSTNGSCGPDETMGDVRRAIEKMQADNQVLLETMEGALDDSPTATARPSPSLELGEAASNQGEEPSYPPLPCTPFPSSLSMEAASYSVPPRLRVQLALIRQPPSLSMLWDLEQDDPAAPPMDIYRLYLTVESRVGSGVFLPWRCVFEVKATPLPMCVMISRYKPGHRVGLSVVGRDKFGRFGPYSTVAPVTVPP